MKKLYSFKLLLIFLFILSIKNVYAIPSSSIIPFIGPIIAQIVLLVTSAFLLTMATVSKYKIYFLIGGVLLIIIFLMIRLI